MKRRWKILIAVLAVPIAVILALTVQHYHLRWETEAYIAQLKAQGEPMTLAQVLPPPVPSNQNGEEIVETVHRLMVSTDSDWTNEPDAMFMVAPGKAVISYEQPDVRDYEFTNSWSNVMAAMETNHSAIEVLRQVLNYPAFDFHLQYGPDVDMQLAHLAWLSTCENRLSGEAICNLRDGDAASSLTNICILLALINGETDERTIYSQYKRATMTQFAANMTWQFLQYSNLNETELTTLQKKWAQLEYTRAMKNTFLMSRVINVLTIKKMRESKTYFDQRMGSFGSCDIWDFAGEFGDELNDIQSSITRDYAKPMWRTTWSYSDELQMLKSYQLILETFPTIETTGYYYPACSNLIAVLDVPYVSDSSSDSAYIHWWFSQDVVATSHVLLDEAMTAEAGKRLIVTAIALKRYQLKHGNYPSDLKALVPEFLFTVPMDPVDGKPLRYRSNPDGTFLLYSIGLNGKDDGGNASRDYGSLHNRHWLDRHSLDWVWPQPATPKEIQNYYAHLPK